MTDDAPSFSVTTDLAPPTATVRVVGDVDPSTAPDLQTAIDHCVASEVTEIVVDLSAVPFLDSSGLRALVTGVHGLGDQGRLRVRDPQPAVRRVMDLAGLSEAFHVT